MTTLISMGRALEVARRGGDEAIMDINPFWLYLLILACVMLIYQLLESKKRD